MSSRSYSGASSSAGKTVNKSTFNAVLIVMIVIIVILSVLIPVEYLQYIKTLAKLQNNICPVRN